MNHIALPALNGRLPLGFLAACGTLRLLSEDGAPPPKLSWDPMAGTAILSDAGDLDTVVERLQRVAKSVPEGALLPGGPPGFPAAAAPEDWPRGDPMRMPVNLFESEVERWRDDLGRDLVNTWVPAMVTDLVEDDQGCASLSPFAAPSGQQKFATMFEKVLGLVRAQPNLIREALTTWRRVEGVTGEYLDHHVLQSAADRSDGQSKEIGVPGATWLALMSFPWFPVSASAGRALAGGWQQLARTTLLVWPLWEDPLPSPTVQVLFTHPGLRLQVDGDGRPAVDVDALRPLSVFQVCAAERQRISGRNFAGVLTPAPISQKPGPSSARS